MASEWKGPLEWFPAAGKCHLPMLSVAKQVTPRMSRTPPDNFSAGRRQQRQQLSISRFGLGVDGLSGAEGLLVFDHGVQDGEEFAHASDQSLLGWLACGSESQVEGSHLWAASNGG